MRKTIRITHRPTGTVVAEGPLGWGNSLNVSRIQVIGDDHDCSDEPVFALPHCL
jgi:hypothetical protein